MAFLQWVLTNRPFVSAGQRGPRLSALPARLLQNIVSKHSSQFRGNAQHDALEFLLWLLDRMHEDLGAASPAQRTRVPEEVGGPGRGGRTPWLRGRCPHQVWDQGSRHVLGGGGLELSPPPHPGMGWGCGGCGLAGGRMVGCGCCGAGQGSWGAGRALGVSAGAHPAEHPGAGGHPASWGCSVRRRSSPPPPRLQLSPL